MQFTDKYDWIDALRSGKYKQGTGRLRDTNNRFCCLGVRCDLEDPNRWRRISHRRLYYWEEYFGYLPEEIRLRDGITREQQVELGNLNDAGRPFDEIAEWIWENIPATVD